MSILSKILGSSLLLASGLAAAEPAPPPAPLPLRVVSRETFCTRMLNTFTNYGNANGYDKVQTTLLASGATAAVINEFRAGRATDYVNAAALAAFSNVPNRAPQNAFLPLAGFVGQAMGLGDNVTLALSTAELRFIPFAQKGMDVVVIAQNAAALTPDRAKKVAEVARSMSIRVNVVWVGPTPTAGQDIEDARSLAWLTATTGGAFANLGGTDSPCGGAM